MRTMEVRPTPSVWPAVLVFLAATLTSIAALYFGLIFFFALPSVHQVRFLIPEQRAQMQEKLTQAYRDVPDDVRQAQILRFASMKFAEAWRDPSLYLFDIEHEISTLIPQVTRSQFGQLHVLALRLLAQERIDPRPTAWLPAARGLLANLRDDAVFGLLDGELRTFDTAAYRAVRMSRGMAAMMSASGLGQPHLLLMQFLGERLPKLADAAREAGDAAFAERLERLWTRGLKTWVLEPGPAPQRLYAARLLAAQLQRGEQKSAAAEAIREMIDLYHQRAVRDSVVGIYTEAALAPQQHDATARAALGVLTLSGQLLAAAIPGILLGLFAMFRVKAPISGLVLAGVLVAVLVAGGGWLIAASASDALLARELRGAGLGWPQYGVRAPLLSAGATLIGLFVVAWLIRGPAPTNSLLTRLGGAGLGAWLATALMMLAAANWGNYVRRDMDQAVSVAAGDPLAAVLRGAEQPALEAVRGLATTP